MPTLKLPTKVERRIIKCHCCEREASADVITVKIESPLTGGAAPIFAGYWVQPPPWWFVTGHVEEFAEGERAGMVFRCPVCSGSLRALARSRQKKAKAKKCGH